MISEVLENGSIDLDEDTEPEGITFLTSSKASDKDAVMDLANYIHHLLEEMDWESLPLQGRLKKEDVVIKIEIK